MADLKREGLNNQKRISCSNVSEVMATSATIDDVIFTLPANSYVKAAGIIVTTISGEVTDTIDIKVGDTVVANEVVTGALGIQAGTQAPAYFPTGGDVSVVAGADAPNDAGRFRVVVEYLELDKVSGEYTN
jgi:hypothetical protein